MTDIRSQLSVALKDSLRAKDTIATSTLRLILAALKDRDIAARAKGPDSALSDEDILLMLQTMVKQRRESITMYEQGGRLELAEHEQGEIAVIERFLPKQLDETEASDAIGGVIADLKAESLKEMGAVMAELRNRYAGRMDFGKAAGLVKAQLSHS
ncbi:MAG: GatB/YqeY domain-containing protein [Alphaproteobacteria bacterium]|nr:GatB/YqeY domain-containing protein [Alphaproteobacteria bacterium]